MLVPATTSTGTRSSSRTFRTPTCARPCAEPPERTRPMRGRSAGTRPAQGAPEDHARGRATPHAAVRIGPDSSRAWDAALERHYDGSLTPIPHTEVPGCRDRSSRRSRGRPGRPLAPRSRRPPRQRRLRRRHDDPGHSRFRSPQTLDTTDATADGDPAVSCATPAPGKSVWYTFRPETSDTYVFDTYGSSPVRLPARPHALHGRVRRADARGRRPAPAVGSRRPLDRAARPTTSWWRARRSSSTRRSGSP